MPARLPVAGISTSLPKFFTLKPRRRWKITSTIREAFTQPTPPPTP